MEYKTLWIREIGSLPQVFSTPEGGRRSRRRSRSWALNVCFTLPAIKCWELNSRASGSLFSIICEVPSFRTTLQQYGSRRRRRTRIRSTVVWLFTGHNISSFSLFYIQISTRLKNTCVDWPDLIRNKTLQTIKSAPPDCRTFLMWPNCEFRWSERYASHLMKTRHQLCMEWLSGLHVLLHSCRAGVR